MFIEALLYLFILSLLHVISRILQQEAVFFFSMTEEKYQLSVPLCWVSRLINMLSKKQISLQTSLQKPGFSEGKFTQAGLIYNRGSFFRWSATFGRCESSTELWYRTSRDQKEEEIKVLGSHVMMGTWDMWWDMMSNDNSVFFFFSVCFFVF